MFHLAASIAATVQFSVHDAIILSSSSVLGFSHALYITLNPNGMTKKHVETVYHVKTHGM